MSSHYGDGSSHPSSPNAVSTSSTAKVKHASGHPEQVWYGLLGVLACATAVNAAYAAWAAYRRRQARTRSARRTSAGPPCASTNSKRPSVFRVPHAMLSAVRIVGFRRRIPKIDLQIVEVLFTVFYMGACLAWIMVPTDDVLPRANLDARYWGNKAGKMVALQLPFIVLLAMKNNPITLLTGIGHERLNILHRVVSRCLLVLAWLHLVGMYYRGPQSMLNAPWKVTGLVGLLAQTITTLTSFKPIRRRFYESFFASHVILVLIFLAAVHTHVAARHLSTYIWPVWLLWALDRLLRAGRYLLNNFNVLSLRRQSPSARVEAIGAGALRVTLKRRIPGGWTAGQHAFLAFPALGVQSHPFTIGNVYEPLRGTGKTETDTDTYTKTKMGRVGNGRCKRVGDREGKGGEEAEMMFIIRAMHGQTRVLLDRALTTGSCELAAMVDGPYGCPADIRPFATCVFIAGGTGITYTIARMHQLFRDVQTAEACARRIVFVWAIRTEAEYKWIASDLDRIVASPPPSLSLTAEVYLTSPRHADGLECPYLPALGINTNAEEDIEKGSALVSVLRGPDEDLEESTRLAETNGIEEVLGSNERRESTSSFSSPTKPESAYFVSEATTPTALSQSTKAGAASRNPYLKDFPHPGPVGVRRRYGRPNVYRILEEEVAASKGAVAVDVSGPDGLVDAVRRALCAPFAGPEAALRGAPTIMLTVEQFRM